MGRVEWDVHEFGEIDSTNRWLADRAVEGASHGLVAIAGVQTAGRGRLGRTWTAPPNSGLLMSVLLRPELPREHWHLLTLHMAVSACDAARSYGATVSLKWPNDLVARRRDGEERKLAGVLAQGLHGSQPAVVLGIGLNLVRPSELPDEVSKRGVWLDELIDPVPRCRPLADMILDRLGELLDEPVGRVVELARNQCSTLGRMVRVELASSAVLGVAVDIGDDGALLVESDGAVSSFHVGDVVHLR